MSDAPTFSSPAGPTVGLQGYNLSRRVRNLDPATSTLSRKRSRAAALLRLKRRSSQLNKDQTMTDTIGLMVETLEKSVADIVAAGGRGDLLTKTFSEFSEAVGQAVKEATDGAVADALTKVAPPEPLFKNLGAVGEVANLVNDISTTLQVLQEAHEAGDVEISDDVAALLDNSLASAELALRESVNEQIMLPNDEGVYEGDTDGTDVIVIKLADGSEIEGRTHLPEELAKFATDPDGIANHEIGMALGVLVKNGVPEGALEKIFDEDGEPMAKLAGMDGAPQPGDGNEADEGAGGDDGDPIQQLQMLGRLLAASLIQLDGVMRSIEGGGDEMAGPVDPDEDGDDDSSPETDTDQDAGSGDAAPAKEAAPADSGDDEESKKKPPFAKSAPDAAGVAKAAAAEAVDGLRKELDGKLGEVTALLTKVLARPEAPRAVLVDPSRALSKSADGAVSGGTIAVTPELKEMILNKMSPEERAAAEYKMSSLGRSPQDVLAKYL